MRKLYLAAFTLGLSFPFAALAQSAADYPSKPVRLIAASAPGASTDILGRFAANWLQVRLKQPFVVDNRPGGNGVVGADIVAKAPPDGYTLLDLAHSIALQNLLIKDLPYDPMKDFAPIAIMAGSGYAMIVPTTLPVKTLSEFVAYGKANPGKLNMGQAGGFAPEMEEMKDMLGVKIENVMYKGGAPLTTAISSGEVQLMFGGVFQGIALQQTGKAHVIAYTGLKRHAAMPDVPTLAESGFPGYSTGFWLGLFGPGGLPPAIAVKLNKEILEMNKAPETVERYKALGYETYDFSPERVRQEIVDLNRRAALVVQRLGIKPQ